MTTVGIIAEYNPFHNGHKLQLQEIRRRFPGAGIVAIMSGSFTQRGTAAVLDKWKRAEAAVRHGVSLVIELPAVFATLSAQYFASGGVRLLERLGVIDILAFGSECTNLEKLQALVRQTELTAEGGGLQKHLQSGGSYASALTDAAATDSLLRQPNVILALEYLRALSRISSSMMAVPLPRIGAEHNETNLPVEKGKNIASASAIRSAIAKSNTGDDNAFESALDFVPPVVKTMLMDAKKHKFADSSLLLRPILSHLLTDDLKTLRSAAGVSEGLEHRLRNAALRAETYDALIESVQSKRYPRTRIRRLLLHLLLSLTKEKALLFDEQGPLYARILALDEKGRQILRNAKHQMQIPLIAKVPQFLPIRTLESENLSPAQEMLSFDLRATTLASLTSCPVGSPPANADFLNSPFYLEK